MADGERYSGSAERTAEVEKAAAERSAELREKTHKLGENGEHGGEQEVTEARLQANLEAKSIEEHRPANEEKQSQDPSGFSRSASYKQTLRNIQSEMSGPSRVFSKIIHNKTVDKTSDFIGNTVARPNAILSGAVCAFVLVFGLYTLAKYMGFALYGSETIAAFIIGWVLGVLFDLLRGVFRRRR